VRTPKDADVPREASKAVRGHTVGT